MRGRIAILRGWASLCPLPMVRACRTGPWPLRFNRPIGPLGPFPQIQPPASIPWWMLWLSGSAPVGKDCQVWHRCRSIPSWKRSAAVSMAKGYSFAMNYITVKVCASCILKPPGWGRDCKFSTASFSLTPTSICPFSAPILWLAGELCRRPSSIFRLSMGPSTRP